MTTQVKYIAFGGGLNVIDSQLTMPEGMMTECVNFEQVFGQQGYSRIEGYERYDGRLEPHLATYYVQEFDTGTAAIAVGDIVTGATATAEVLAVEPDNLVWNGTAAGRLILGNVTGTWANNEAINVTTQKALASAATYQGSISETLNTAYKALAIEDRRTAITAPTGSGPIRGIGVANNITYCVRDSADGTYAQLFKSTVAGWEAVKFAPAGADVKLWPGGDVRMIQANFSGSTQSLYLFGCDGKNRSWKFDGTTFTFMAPIWGSQATSATSLLIETGVNKAFTCAQTLRSFATGQEFYAWSSADASKWMKGTFVSYVGDILTISVTSKGGTGTVSDWEISRSDFSDKPYDLVTHRDHLFLAYPYGQLQTSNLGDPMTYTTTAALIGTGADITGMTSIKGGVLSIHCDGRLFLLEGSDKTTWSMTTNSMSAGATFKTVQEIAGSVIGLDVRGLTSLQATLNFGSFEMSVFSRFVKPYLDALMPTVVGSTVVRSKNQYRLYTSTGVVLIVTLLTPNPQILASEVSITRANYEVGISTVARGEIDGEEYLFFGTTDGMVMREAVGASFDGEEILSVIRTPFWSLKSPAQKKRFRKLEVEIEAPQLTSISYRELFDYADGNYMPSINQSTDIYGGGGQWDVDNWDTFQWSLPVQTVAEANIAGVGRNMCLLISHASALDEAFRIKGLIIQYSPLGLAR